MIRPVPMALTAASLLALTAALYGWAAQAGDIYMVLGQSLVAWCL